MKHPLSFFIVLHLATGKEAKSLHHIQASEPSYYTQLLTMLFFVLFCFCYLENLVCFSVLRFVYRSHIPKKDCHLPERYSTDLKKGNYYLSVLKLLDFYGCRQMGTCTGGLFTQLMEQEGLMVLHDPSDRTVRLDFKV